MIDIKHLRVDIAGNEIVSDFSLTCKPNSINAIIGPNGCGKTTILKGLCGLNHSDSLIYVNNNLFDPLKQKQDYIAAFLEGGSYYGNMNTIENLNYACMLNQVAKSKINEIIEMVDFPKPQLKTKASGLSLGQRQKLGLAMVLILERPLLLLDEPLNGLDIDAVEGFNELLLKVKTETNTTILITSHLIAKLLNITDTISILKDGQLRYQCDIDQIGKTLFTEHKNLDLTQLLTTNNISFTETKKGILIKGTNKEELTKTINTTNLAVTFSIPTLEETYKHVTT